jgi:hypothetical protein
VSDVANRIQASATFRRFALGVALLLAVLETGAFFFAWRLGSLLDPGADHRAALAFVALGSALTLQAMAVVGIAWTLVAWSRTSLTYDQDELSLEHPWREWRGGWSDVQHAWSQRGWLVVELHGQWRRWYVHTGGAGAHAISIVREHLPPGSWLQDSALRMHLVRTVLPLLLAAVGAGGLVLLLVLQALDRALRAQ